MRNHMMNQGLAAGWRLRSLAGWLVIGLAQPALLAGAQQPENPFGQAAAPAAPNAAPQVPAATTATTPPAKPADLGVSLLGDWAAASPESRVAALSVLVDMKRLDAAKAYLQTLLEANLSADRLVALRRRFGSPYFVRLSQIPELLPESAKFAQLVLETARKADEDAARTAALVKQLTATAPAERRAALVDLRPLGGLAVPPILTRLGDPAQAEARPALRAALVALGSPAEAPLSAALQAPGAALRADVVEVLGRLGQPHAARWLASVALADPDPALRAAAAEAFRSLTQQTFSAAEATHYLEQTCREWLDESHEENPGDPRSTDYWSWDSAQQTLVHSVIPRADAALLKTVQLARILFAADPQQEAHRELLLRASLEALQRGYAVPFPTEAAASVGQVERLLARSLAEDSAGAAYGAAKILGEIGSSALVEGTGGHARPLVEALRHPDLHVRFAAAEAIQKLDPRMPFAGSSHLVDLADSLLRSDSQPRVLVGDPDTEASQTLVGWMASSGWASEAYPSGKALLRAAMQGGPCEAILLAETLDHPDVLETLQWLRRDARTASIPIGILRRHDDLPSSLGAIDDPRTIVLARPQDATSVAGDLQRLTALSGRRAVTPQQRQAYAAAALEWVARWAEHPDLSVVYDVLRLEPAIRHALDQPSLGPQAAKVLGLMATPRAQSTLTEIAGDTTRPIDTRTAAAQAFQEAIARRRVLLTRGQILALYDRFNDTPAQDVPTRKLLGAVLDALEGHKTGGPPAP